MELFTATKVSEPAGPLRENFTAKTLQLQTTYLYVKTTEAFHHKQLASIVQTFFVSMVCSSHHHYKERVCDNMHVQFYNLISYILILLHIATYVHISTTICTCIGDTGLRRPVGEPGIKGAKGHQGKLL